MMHGLVLSLLSVTALAAKPVHSDSHILACVKSEAFALGNAPPSVRRISADRLRIEWRKGTRFFVNSGLEDGELAGIRYEYCGSALGYHLIGKLDDGLFTGVLLDTASGNVLPAGRTVQFAPDGARYLATQQPDGLDGEEWLVYSQAGTQLWKGESGISAKSREGNWEYFIATLEQPRWSVAGELEATLQCTADTTQMATVTLRASGGHYIWVPTIECAP